LTECGAKTGHRWSVSNPGLIVEDQHAPAGTTFHVRKAVSLEDAEAASMPVLVQRFTEISAAFRTMKLSSRSCFMRVAIRSRAKSHETCLKWLLRGA
jgi:hypothetical protein